MDGLLETLLADARLWRARGGTEARDPALCVPTGWPKLDARLPGRGWPLGTLIEFLLPETGIGELSLLLPALGALVNADDAGRRWLAWIAPPHAPYAPALAQSGIRADRLLLVGAEKPSDRLWAIEQALRSGGCAAVLAWLDAADDRWLRRLKLAAETGRTLAVLMRPARRRNDASPASLRLVLEPTSRGLDLWLLKSRGRGPSRVPDVLGA
ncbi:MAG TPA: translesion DNA synthesis-associated protein ImuA [Steroidobacteraceae bacterium]|nr:translesion DNA synthesis-associated protein ImuA [Steroidobacteraceae bacterium]